MLNCLLHAAELETPARKYMAPDRTLGKISPHLTCKHLNIGFLGQRKPKPSFMLLLCPITFGILYASCNCLLPEKFAKLFLIYYPRTSRLI